LLLPGRQHPTARSLERLDGTVRIDSGLKFAQSTSGGAGPVAAGPGSPLGGITQNVPVHWSATVTLGVIVLAVLLAIVGGLIAGSLGSWRISRLRPADALARVD
jgi:putative ABC transport system permease protein